MFNLFLGKKTLGGYRKIQKAEIVRSFYKHLPTNCELFPKLLSRSHPMLTLNLKLSHCALIPPSHMQARRRGEEGEEGATVRR